jgi:predicted ATP-grasp superfamily ATP-dependent carboligase
LNPYYKVSRKPEFEDSTLVVCWEEDAGRLGPSVSKYLIDNAGLKLFAEIEPRDYFSLGGVTVENDVAVFPESNFYFNHEKKLVLFKSNLPRFEWYSFIFAILNMAEKVCKVKEIYTVGGMVSISSHTLPRALMGTLNTPDMKTELGGYDISLDMNYETPSGQRPTMSSYLIWAAIQKKIKAASLWVPVPFYMVNVVDTRAVKRLLDFFNLKLDLEMAIQPAEDAIADQNQKIAEISNQFPDLAEIFQKLETNISLDQAESRKVLELVERHLK